MPYTNYRGPAAYGAALLARPALIALAASCAIPALAAETPAANTLRADSASAESAGNAIIVTGTRTEGRRVRESATPIELVSADALTRSGQTNLLDALKDTLPGLNSPAVGYDVGALARTFQLRGLSPSHTLVLVNGKRRHLSSSIYADSDPAQGANAVDLDLIPVNAIARIEVLRDGAAAQYGSDAIAGVVNIILKDGAQGGHASVQGGQYYKGDGQEISTNIDHGFAVGAGRLHVSAGYRYHNFSNRSGETGGVQPAKVQGDPRSILGTASYDYVQPISGSDISVYSFGTYAHRRARANENPRQPGDVSSAVDAIYPNGFTPQETVDENDYSLTLGAKGRLSGWDWDLSSTYGRDVVHLGNINSINGDLLADTGSTQSAFNVGGFASGEWTNNLDLRRALDVGLASPLTLALGVEDRYETYTIRAGEASSYYLGGSAAFPGFRPTDASSHHRNSVAGYIDATVRPISAWEVSGAARLEHYDSVGTRVNGKLATRYEVSPSFALRASGTTGFHAPTLAQQYYSATTVTTGYASIQLPLGSAGANLLGAGSLKPETSRSISAGFVAEPIPGLHLAADGYFIWVNNRIIESAYLYGDLAQAAVVANGTVPPAGLSSDNVSAVFFTNGVNTRTQGVDVTADWKTRLGAAGQISWTAAFGYVENKIRSVQAPSAALAAAGLSLVDAVQTTNLTTATPKIKASLAANWERGAWSVNLRNTYYSNSRQAQGYSTPYFIIDTGNRIITDLAVSYKATPRIGITAGANNLFDITPRLVPAALRANYDQYSHVTPFGINGGSWYVRLGVKL